jgi:hypothetical protein
MANDERARLRRVWDFLEALLSERATAPPPPRTEPLGDEPWRVIDILSAPQRAILDLAAQGWSADEIGAKIGISSAAVDANLNWFTDRRGRRNLVRLGYLYREWQARHEPDRGRGPDAVPSEMIDRLAFFLASLDHPDDAGTHFAANGGCYRESATLLLHAAFGIESKGCAR